MKKLLLPFLLLFSVNILAENLTLDAPFVNLGYLDSVNGLPFNQTFTFTRTEATPDTVVLNFSYTQVEMICADRMPDGGGYGYGYGGGYGGGCNGDYCEPEPSQCPSGGCHPKSIDKYYGDYSYGFGHSGHHGFDNHRGFDRNFMGICRHWTTMETQKSGRVKLIFRAAYENESGDIIKVNIHQRDLHSTAFWVSGWCPGYEVTNHSNTIVFE